MIDIPRDRWDRPLIQQAEGKPRPYTRVSTLAKALDETSNLTAWKCRMTAVGMAQSRHLIQRAAAIANKYDDPVTEGRSVLNGLVEEAMTTAGSGRAADTGTALHDMTEVLDLGRDLSVVPGEFRALLDTYQRTMRGVEVLACEVFVVVDELEVAGTFDRMLRLPDGRVVIADLKTGQHEPKYPLGVATQVAMYAHGQRYDPATGERTPLHPDLDTTMGLLIHLPVKAPWPVCDLYELDLEVGWAAAELAVKVRQTRKAKPIKPYVIPEPDLFTTEAAS